MPGTLGGVRVASGIGRLLVATLLAGALVAGLLLPYSIGFGLASNKVTDAIQSAEVAPLDEPMPLRTTITDINGKPIAYLYEQNRVYVPLSEISSYLQKAVIAIEDRRFMGHHGVDWRSTTRAMLQTAGASTEGPRRGGSTLTQQLVKNILFLVNARTEAEKADAIAATPIRKLREAKMALSLETGPKKKTKDEILELYLNLVAFGPSTYGAEASSMRYFGVHASDLTLGQAAMLAGMVNNPNKFNPLSETGLEEALKRRNIVLDQMATLKIISKAVADREKKTPALLKPSRTLSGCINAPQAATNGYFCTYVLDYLRNVDFDAATLARGGYTIRTTLDPKAMKAAKSAVNAQADPTLNETKRIANVIAIVEPGVSTRKVLALAANRPYGTDAKKGQTEQRLTTTFAPLGAGSTFKVFTAAAAMEMGLGTEAEVEVEKEYTSPLVPTHPFKNASENFASRMTLAQALATSPNTAFVALEDQVGLDKVADMAVRLGLRGYQLDAGEVDQAFTGLGTTYQQQVFDQKMASFTLGVSPVSPLELANVAATLDSDGVWCPPTPIDTILDRDGSPVQWKQLPCAEAVDPQLAHTLTEALRGDLAAENGTAHQSAVALGWNRPAAGKTGTTQDYKSSAYMGFTPHYASAVLVFDYLSRPTPICKEPLRSCSPEESEQPGKGMSGGSVPAATWLTAMTELHKELPSAEFRPASPEYLAGKEQAQIPQVVNLLVDAAKIEVENAGFKVKVVHTNKTGAAANVVVEQHPKLNALPGTTVTLTVATGAAQPVGTGAPEPTG